MYEGVVQELIDELGRLPGVGPKSAQRIAFYLLQTEDDHAKRLAQVLLEVKERVRFCEVCGNVSEEDRCNICRDPRRSQTSICVVEESKDVQAIERTREFKGLYHVLGGAISPIEGIGPDNLRAWQNTVGYVPQQIFLVDDSVAANIAFGRAATDIDRAAVERAARIAEGG